MSKSENSTNLNIQVHPKAARNSVVRNENSVWHLKIAAPPVEGKANKELIEYLSNILDTGKSRLSIEKGETSHRKVVLVAGLSIEQVEERLKRQIKQIRML
jgi:uncharacterized protein